MSLPYEIQLKKQSNRLGWILTAMIGIIWFSSFLIYGLSNLLAFTTGEKPRIMISAILESFLYMCAFLLPAVLYYILPHRNACQPIGFSFRLIEKFPCVLLAFLGINLGMSFLNSLFCQTVGLEQETEALASHIQNPEIMLLYMTISLAPAFAEEILFRGVIYTNLRPYGKNMAILGSAVLFGFMHMNVSQFLYTTMAGVMLAVLYEMTGSVWSGVLIHMCNNLYSIIQTVIAIRLPSAKGTAVSYLVQALVIFGSIISIVILWYDRQKKASRLQATEDTVPQGFLGYRQIRPSWQVDTEIPLRRGLFLTFTTPGMVIFTILALAIMMIQ